MSRRDYDWTSFRGYSGPSFTQIPDEMLDHHLPALSGGEAKALLYIARKTYGWKKDWDAISLRQMLLGTRRRDGSYLDRGVGVSKATLVAALDSLEAKGLLFRKKPTKSSHEATVYALNVGKSEAPWEGGSEIEPATPGVAGAGLKTEPASGLLSARGGGSESEHTRNKETNKHLQQTEPPSTPPEGAGEALLEVVEDSGPPPEDRVWQAYREALAEFGKNPNEYRFTEPLRALVRSRLAEYPVEDVMDAAKGWLRDPFYRGSNDRGKPYYGLALLLAIDRRRNNVEKLRDLERDFRAGRIKPAAVTKGAPAQPSIKRDPSEYAGWSQHGLHITENQA